MLTFLFPAISFNQFATQSQWIADVIHQHRSIKQLPFHHKIMRYLDYQNDMAVMLAQFNQQTRSILGWISSWVPYTDAFNSRKSVSIALTKSMKLHHEIQLGYCQHVREKAKKQLHTMNIQSMLKQREKVQLAQKKSPMIINDAMNPIPCQLTTEKRLRFTNP